MKVEREFSPVIITLQNAEDVNMVVMMIEKYLDETTDHVTSK